MEVAILVEKDNTINEEVEEEKDELKNEENEQTDPEQEELNESENQENTNEPVKKLEEKVETLQKEKEELYQRVLRLQAEFDNYKKRTQKEKLAERKYQSQDIVTDLLPALDNFERALQVEVTDNNKSLYDGISMVYRQIMDALESHGVTPIESVGKEFDPNSHHAVMQVEDESHESNEIVEELQKGYMLKDRVIRPAMVKVNK